MGLAPSLPRLAVPPVMYGVVSNWNGADRGFRGFYCLRQSVRDGHRWWFDDDDDDDDWSRQREINPVTKIISTDHTNKCHYDSVIFTTITAHTHTQIILYGY